MSEDEIKTDVGWDRLLKKPLEAKTAPEVLKAWELGLVPKDSTWLNKEDILSLLPNLRKINCTCDDGSLCVEFKPEGITTGCRECCESFCKMWDELERLLGAK